MDKGPAEVGQVVLRANPVAVLLVVVMAVILMMGMTTQGVERITVYCLLYPT